MQLTLMKRLVRAQARMVLVGMAIHLAGGAGPTSANNHNHEEAFVHESFGRCKLSGTCRALGLVDAEFEDVGMAFNIERFCLKRARSYFDWCGNRPDEQITATHMPTNRSQAHPAALCASCPPAASAIASYLECRKLQKPHCPALPPAHSHASPLVSRAAAPLVPSDVPAATLSPAPMPAQDESPSSENLQQGLGAGMRTSESLRAMEEEKDEWTAWKEESKKWGWTKEVAHRQKLLLPTASSPSSSSSRLGQERILLLRMNPFMGFSNRFFAMASALMVSLAGDRALLIDWPADSRQRRHPNGESSLMPPLRRLFNLPDALDLEVLLGSYADPAAAADELFADEDSWLKLNEDSAQLIEILQQGHIAMAFPQRGVEIWAVVGSYLGHHLLDNPTIRPKMLQLFSLPLSSAAVPLPSAFMQVARYLMSEPSKLLRDAFSSSMPRRVGERDGTGSRGGGSRGLGVVEGDRGVGGADAAVCVHLRSFLMSKEEQFAALECAVRLVHRVRGGAGDGGANILLSSDTHAAGILAQQVLERSLAKNQSSTSVTWEVLSQFGRGSETESIYGVAALLHLSRCRQLVGTSRSTFLLLAAALSPMFSSANLHAEFAVHDVHAHDDPAGTRCVAKKCRLPPAPPDCWAQAD